MLHKYFELAQKLGDSLAQIDMSRIVSFLISKPKTDGYIWIQILPLRNIEDAVASWTGFIKSWSNISSPIYMISHGNSQKIQLIIGIPSDYITYFQNIYTANFPSSDSAQISYELPVGEFAYINFQDNPIASDADFQKNGIYNDPWRDVLSLYHDVSMHENLTICNIYKFDKKTLLSKISKNISNIGGSDDKTVDLEDDNFYVKFGVAYAITSGDISKKSQLNQNILSIYNKFVKTGSISVSHSPHFQNIISINQIINFFHLPSSDQYIHGLEYNIYRKLPYPTDLPTLDNIDNKNNLTIIGRTDYKDSNIQFGISNEDKLRHMYIIGKTGTGKSKFIANLIKSDMISNKGLCLIDPHGDLVEDVISQIPSYRVNDVILFDVADTQWPIGFNIFDYQSEEEKPLIASGVVAIFKKLYGNSRGPRLEYILRNVVLSLLEYPNSTLMHLVRMLTDASFKEEVLSYVTDPVILKFWRGEYDKYSDKQREEAIAPITNKVGQFISSKIVRNIFAQSKTKLNIRRAMDEGKIVLINLSKGRIGDDNCNMIGSFLVSKLQIDAMSRADISESLRREFYLYIDEFQNFATESFATILSEARKYKLGLVVANQFTSQIEETTRSAIFGNVGTIISMTVGYDDAVIMAQQFRGIITADDIQSLPNRSAYIRLKIRGKDSIPFSMRTADYILPEDSTDIITKIRDQSRQRYAISRSELETIIQTRSDRKFSATEKVMDKIQNLKSHKSNTPSKNTSSQNTVILNSAKAEQAPVKDLVENDTDDHIYMQDNLIASSADISTTDDDIDIQIGHRYDGLVKLQYNYGIFVVLLNGAEGLLHKSQIPAPDGVSRKKLYNIGDPIQVKCTDISTDSDGKLKYIWSQID